MTHTSNDTGGTGDFRVPIPKPEKGLNLKVKEAVVLLVDHYKGKNSILDFEELNEVDVAKILAGVRDVIYMYEGRKPPQINSL